MNKEYLREAVEGDMSLLFKWVNDPLTRASAFHTKEISYEEHKKWFRSMMNDNDVLQYIYEVDGKPVGQIRVNKIHEIGEIDYSIASEERSLGYGNRIVKLLIEKMKMEHPEVVQLRARVKAENIVSQRIFQKNNFEIQYLEFQYKLGDVS